MAMQNGTLEHCIITTHKSLEYWNDAVIDPDGNGVEGSMPNDIFMIISPNQNLPGPNGETQGTNGYYAVHEKDFSISGAPSGNYEDWGMVEYDLGCGTDFADWEFDSTLGDFVQTGVAEGWPHNSNELAFETNLLYATNLAHDVNAYGVDPDLLITGPGAWAYIDWETCSGSDCNQIGYVGQNGDGQNIPLFRVFLPQHVLGTLEGYGDWNNVPQNNVWDDDQTDRWYPISSWDATDRIEFDAKWDEKVAFVAFQNFRDLPDGQGGTYVAQTDEYLNPPSSNKVIVWIRLKDEVVMPPNDLDIKIDINGDAKWIEIEPNGQPANIHGAFDIVSHTDNGGIETFTVADGFELRTETRDPGFTSATSSNDILNKPRERKIYSFYGVFKRNKPTVVGTVKVEAGDNKTLTSNPYLGLYSELKNLSTTASSFIKLRRKKTSTNSVCEFDIVYTAKSEINKSNRVSARFYHSVRNVTTREDCINNININGLKLKNTGGNKALKISGKPGSVIAFSINENIYDIENESHSEDGSKERVRQFNQDVSILGNKANSTYIDSLGNTVPIVQKTIGKSGAFRFVQRFPNSIVKSTTMPAAYTNASRIILSDASDIKVGDRVYYHDKGKNTVLTVSDINVGGNANQIDISGNLTTTANDIIWFKREREYSLNIIENLSSPICSPAYETRSTISGEIYSHAPTINTSYTFKQHFDPLLIIKVTTAGLAYKINGGAMGAEYSVTYVGKPNLTNSENIKQNNSRVEIPVTIELTNGTSNFTGITSPDFDYRNPTNGEYAWSNSNVSGRRESIYKIEKASTEVDLIVLSTGTTGATSLTVKLMFIVKKWGEIDTTLELNLDNILTMA